MEGVVGEGVGLVEIEPLVDVGTAALLQELKSEKKGGKSGALPAGPAL